MTGKAFNTEASGAAARPGRRAADPPTAPLQAVPDPSITIDAVIRLCLEQGRADDWDPHRQRALAREVLRRLRPEWSDSQISDAVHRAAGGTPAGPVVL